MSLRWRLIDTRTRRPAQNVALNRALLESRAAGEAPSTLRFARFTPCVLLGCQQSAHQELHVEYCAACGIEVQRRITGGEALYLDDGQIGWELYLDRRDLGIGDRQRLAERVFDVAASALRRLGVDARYRPGHDIEVDGRKIGTASCTFEGGAVMFQGTILVSVDIERLVHVLRLPAAGDQALAGARERVASLEALLGRAPDKTRVQSCLASAFSSAFDVVLEAGRLNVAEQARYDEALPEIAHRDWAQLLSRPAGDTLLLESSQRLPGGILRTAVIVDQPARLIKQVWFTGDFPVQPRRTALDLEARLRDCPLDAIEQRVQAFFAEREVSMPGLTPLDIALALHRTLLSGKAQGQRGGRVGRPGSRG